MNRRVLLLMWMPLLACHKDPALMTQETRQIIESFSLDQSTLGKRSWNLNAELAILDETGQEAVLTKPRMKLYKNNKPVTTVSAATGLIDTKTYDLRLSSDVVVASLEDDSTLKTSELNYSSERKKFITDRDVMVIRRGGTLRGRGLQASPDLSEVRIFNQKAIIGEGPF